MDIRALREKMGLSQQGLSDKTGIPKDRISAWEQGRGSPKVKDFDTLRKFFTEQVSHETLPLVNEDAPKYGNFTLQALIDTNKIMAESNMVLAKANENLVSMLKVSQGADPERRLIFDAMLPGLQELLIDLGMGTQWKTRDEGIANVHKLLFGGLKKIQAKDTHIDSGNASKGS